MTRQDKAAELAKLLQDTGHAHHQAFLATDGADPDWPIWYAGHMAESLPAALGTALSQTDIVRILLELDAERVVREPMDQPWPLFYGEQLVARFVGQAEETLTLYVMQGCPFCQRVTSVIERLGLDIPHVDVYDDANARRDLVAARGRATVPVLRCVAGDLDRWMPESADIIRYLEARFGS